MEKSRSPGNSSSEAPPNNHEADERLRALAHSPLLRAISKPLGTAAKLHIVGGTVREVFGTGKKVDLDLACVFPPEKSAEILTTQGIRIVETGIKHGTILAVIESQHIEITTFRRPGASRPDDYSQSIDEDLGGRDFTINAIAFSIADEKIVDPFGGRDDLKNGILRAVGSASGRFAEDPLRILRMFRFGPAAGRTIAVDTESAARAARATLLSVSPERVREELTKILISDHSSNALRQMLGLGIVEVLLPEILPSVGFEQNEFHMHDVFEHTLWVIERCPLDPILRWSALFHDLGKPRSLSVDDKGRRHFYKHEEYSEELGIRIMERLRFSNADTQAIRAIVRHHMRPLECGPSGIRRLIRDLGEQFDSWRIFKSADAPPKLDESTISEKLGQFNALYEAELARQKGSGLPKLAISGNELIGLGMTPGPQLGRILKRLEEMVIDNPDLNSPESLMQQAKLLLQSCDKS